MLVRLNGCRFASRQSFRQICYWELPQLDGEYMPPTTYGARLLLGDVGHLVELLCKILSSLPVYLMLVRLSGCRSTSCESFRQFCNGELPQLDGEYMPDTT